MKSIDYAEIDLFLKRHAPISTHGQFCVGELFGDWRITAFLGHGGMAVGVGTSRYAAPEQFIGGEISPAADIHALGMLINECFKGE